jgi:quercetin dioxygenase-like cupin family protein
MKMTALMAAIVAAGGILHSTAAPGQAQTVNAQSGTKRTPLQQADLSVPRRQVVQVRVDFDPGYTSPWHTHPGEEVIYVIEGTIEYQVQGRPTKTYKAGEVLIIPYGTPHLGKNVGTTNAAELATYIVEKGKPLITLGTQPQGTGQ